MTRSFFRTGYGRWALGVGRLFCVFFQKDFIGAAISLFERGAALGVVTKGARCEMFYFYNLSMMCGQCQNGAASA